jgi:hypothetical protein
MKDGGEDETQKRAGFFPTRSHHHSQWLLGSFPVAGDKVLKANADPGVLTHLVQEGLGRCADWIGNAHWRAYLRCRIPMRAKRQRLLSLVNEPSCVQRLRHGLFAHNVLANVRSPIHPGNEARLPGGHHFQRPGGTDRAEIHQDARRSQNAPYLLEGMDHALLWDSS